MIRITSLDHMPDSAVNEVTNIIEIDVDSQYALVTHPLFLEQIDALVNGTFGENIQLRIERVE
jgi:hypothetical protein